MKAKFVRLFIAFKMLESSIKELNKAWNDILESENFSGGEGYPEGWECFDHEHLKILDWTKAQIECIKSNH